MSLEDAPTVATFGEALWDCASEGLFLGGAPFNVAFHAARLGAKALPITCVGDDLLGDQVIDRARLAGMSVDLIKRHDILETGVAIARLDEQGNASYDIRYPSAWDEISLDSAERETVLKADALVYGSLATRSEPSRYCLERLLQSFGGSKICDVNLRPPYDDLKRALHFARLADVVKLNSEELYRLIAATPERFDLEDAIRECSLLLGVNELLVTLGAEGAIRYANEKMSRVTPRPVQVKDTIGAGDSFTAAFAVYRLKGREANVALKNAADLGAYVASSRGAQPHYDPARIGLE